MDIDIRKKGLGRIRQADENEESIVIERLIYLLGNLPQSPLVAGPSAKVVQAQSCWENTLSSFETSVWMQLEPQQMYEYIRLGYVTIKRGNGSAAHNDVTIKLSEHEEVWDYKKINWDET